MVEVQTPADASSALVVFRVQTKLDQKGELLWAVTADTRDANVALASFQLMGYLPQNQCRSLSLRADGKDIPLGVTQLRSDLQGSKTGRKLVNGGDELRTVLLPGSSAALLASAGQISGTVCGATFILTDEQRSRFAEFAQKAGFPSAAPVEPAPVETPIVPTTPATTPPAP
jgi:hypothetical protein